MSIMDASLVFIPLLFIFLVKGTGQSAGGEKNSFYCRKWIDICADSWFNFFKQ